MGMAVDTVLDCDQVINVLCGCRKLSVHDKWTKMAVHVAMDMVVVIEDISELCQLFTVSVAIIECCFRNSLSATYRSAG